MKSIREQTQGELPGETPGASGEACAGRSAVGRRISIDISIITLLWTLTLVAFSPAVHCGFNLVDETVVTDQPHVNSGLSAANIRWALTTFDLGYPIPLTSISLMADVSLFGTNPAAFHAENIVWHAASVALLYLLLRRLTGSTWRSAVVTLIFAIHPLRAESVAWITERKDVLAAFFGLLATHTYLSFAKRRSILLYALFTLLFMASLLAKPMLLMLPALLLAIDYWPLKRFSNPWKPGFAPLLEKLPLVLIGAVCVLRGTQAQASMDMLAKHLPFSARAANAIVSYVRYFGKIVYFHGLAMCYPLVPHWPAWIVTAAALILILITVACFLQLRRRPWLAVGWVWYVTILTPAAGFYALSDASIADRYTYFPMIGLLVMLIWSLPEKVAQTNWRWPGIAVLGTIAATMIVTTRAQCLTWRDDVTLWSRAVNTAGPSELACANLAIALSRAHRPAEAIPLYRQALEFNPENGRVQGNLATSLDETGDRSGAVPHYLKAIEKDPADPKLQYNVGTDLVDLDRPREAVPYLRRAAELEPTSIKPAANLATALLRAGDLQGAIDESQKVLKTEPRATGARETLAAALANSGQISAAQTQYLLAIVNDKAAVNSYNALGMIYLQKQQPGSALSYLQQAVRLDPKVATAHNNLGIALVGTGSTQEGVAEFRKAVELDHNYAEAKRNLELAGGGK